MNTPASATPVRTVLPWIIAGIAVIVMALTVFRSRDRGPDPRDAQVAELAARLDAMESTARDPISARPGVAPGRGRGAGMGPGSLQGGPGGLSREVKTPQEMEADRAKQLQELEASFARDQPDPVGGGTAENTLEQTVGGETMKGTGLTPKDVDIACKANSCRIVGSFDKMGDAQDWSLFYITAAGGNVLSQSRMVFSPLADGKTEVRIYSQRAK